MSNEQPQIHRALAAAGIALHTLSARHRLRAAGEVTLANQFTRRRDAPAVRARWSSSARASPTTRCTARSPRARTTSRAAGIRSVTRIGDALAPGAIVHAVYSGHRYARELDARPGEARVPARRAAAAAARRSEVRRQRVSSLPPLAVRPGADAALELVPLRARSSPLEKERIFCREWLCVGREEELAAPGAHRVLDILGESILLVRNREGRLRAFYNVCRHRGSRLCRETGAEAGPAAAARRGIAAGRITCPYHQWTYDFDGRLLAAPYLTAEPRLRQVAVQPLPGRRRVLGRVRVPEPDARRAPHRSQQLAGIPERIARYPLAGAAHRAYDPLRGGRELEGDLRELQRVLPLRRRAPGAVRGRAGLQGARRLGARLAARHPASRRRLYLHALGHHPPPRLPGAERGRAGAPQGRARLPEPVPEPRLRPRRGLHPAAARARRAPTSSAISCSSPSSWPRADFDPSDAVEFWDLVNRQDWAICESVQQGISARVHERGYYAPMEDFNLDIRRYVLERHRRRGRRCVTSGPSQLLAPARPAVRVRWKIFPSCSPSACWPTCSSAASRSPATRSCRSWA